MAQKDYYATLGVPKGASADDIKAAYKKLAKEHHPDVATDKAQAEAKFKEINEAYQILSDPQKKKMYDTYGTAQPGAGGQGPFGGQSSSWGPFSYNSYSSAAGENPFGSDFDPMDIFEQVFGFRDFGGQRRPRKGRDLRYELTISFADAVRGMEDDLSVAGKNLKVKIPAGVQDGNQIRFEGQGEQAKESSFPNGDLYVAIRVQPHRLFQRHGDDIIIAKNISFVDAVLGAEIEIPVVEPSAKSGESTTKLKIPAGTQSETDFRLKGKGMPRLRSLNRGDMYIRVRLEIPAKLSKDQRKLLEDYKKL